jgi:protein involved in polysaccharide export with SLBB domain
MLLPKLLPIVLTVVAFAFMICCVVAQQPTKANSQSGESTVKQCVLVYGAVRSPARFQLERQVRLSQAIALAGGATANNSADVQVIHTRILNCNREQHRLLLDRCTDCGCANFPAPLIDTYKLSELLGEDEKANPYLRPGDIIVVVEAPPIYAMGNVVSPQGLILVPGMTLTKAIAMAGGLRQHSLTKKIRVIRTRPYTSERTEIVIDWEKIKKHRADDFVLKPYDIVEVPMKGVHGYPMSPFLSVELLFPVRIIN